MLVVIWFHLCLHTLTYIQYKFLWRQNLARNTVSHAHPLENSHQTSNPSEKKLKNKHLKKRERSAPFLSAPPPALCPCSFPSPSLPHSVPLPHPPVPLLPPPAVCWRETVVAWVMNCLGISSMFCPGRGVLMSSSRRTANIPDAYLRYRCQHFLSVSLFYSQLSFDYAAVVCCCWNLELWVL